MHTAFSLTEAMFAVEQNGRPISRDNLLDWHDHDRLGVVMDSPLGALGASLLMQLAITAYYDVRSARRTTPHYAEIYLFHFGGRFGDFSNFDLAPTRKEVFIAADSGALIEAINDRAITHLLTPDRSVQPIVFPWKEAEAARDRIQRCFVYDPTGVTARADIEVRALNVAVVENIESTLAPQGILDRRAEFLAASKQPQNTSRWLDRLESRSTEVEAAARATAVRRRLAIGCGGLPRESYRRIEVDQALGMLYTWR